MKKTSLFLVVAFAAMTALYAQTPHPIVGVWGVTKENHSVFEASTTIYTFNSDGTGTVETISHDDGRGFIDTFKWTTNGNTLIKTYSTQSPPPRTYTISGDTITIADEGEYYRTQPQPAWGSNQPSPVGTWEWMRPGQGTATEKYTFNANGTGTFTDEFASYTLKWKAKGNMLTVTRTARNGVAIPATSSSRLWPYSYRIINETITLSRGVEPSEITRYYREGTGWYSRPNIIPKEDVEVPNFGP